MLIKDKALKKVLGWSKRILRKTEKFRACLENHSAELRICDGQDKSVFTALSFFGSFFDGQKKNIENNNLHSILTFAIHFLQWEKRRKNQFKSGQ